MKLVLHTHTMELGKEYWICFPTGAKVVGKLIKVTRKGYNFLREETGKCIFKQHLYPRETNADGSIKVVSPMRFRLARENLKHQTCSSCIHETAKKTAPPCGLCYRKFDKYEPK